jgi:hypothetical protein
MKMATARKCDRCGKYYDRNELERSCANYSGRMARISHLKVYTNFHGIMDSSDEYDLCDECWEKFFKFIGEEVEEEVEPEPYKEQDTKCDMCDYLPNCIQEGNVMESYNVYDMKIHHVRRRGGKCTKEVEDGTGN